MGKAVKVQGIECPLIREGDNIVDIVVENVLSNVAYWSDIELRYKQCDILGYDIEDKDIIGITESIVARAAGQYITVDEIASDIENKFGKDATIILDSPIYSRNRFATILKGIARAAKKIIIAMPQYDEVGNPRRINPFTGVNIEEYYKKLCENENCDFEIIYGVDYSLCFSSNLIYCGLHQYNTWKFNSGFNRFDNKFTLADICSNISPDWGVLGSNSAGEERLKLFPSKAECERVCNTIKEKIKEKTGKDIIVCVYGDGCFKDPVGGIWEFADPVTMPGYTDKELIESTPHEFKLKYLIDTIGPEGIEKAEKRISQEKRESHMGTTPRLYRDLLASLMDLTSGSGDRATPVILVQNYF